MASSKVYLITGANRGLGRGLLSSLIQRPNTTVIAGVRNLSSESTTSLSTLPTGTGSKIITVKIDSTIPSSATDAINELTNTHSISALDVVIANAGISNYYGPAVSTPLAEAREHLEVNVIGTLALFQATWPLLEKAKKPIFVALSTGLASITDMGSMPVQATAYGMSKAALNYMVRKIHFENEALISFVISPGWVQTDMGTYGAKSNGMEEAPVTLEDSINGMLAKIDTATRENMSGTLQSYDEQKYAW